MTETPSRRHTDKPWYRDARFFVPMIFTVLMSGATAFLGSWIASSNRIAELGQIVISLQHSIDELKGRVNSVQALGPQVSKLEADTEHNTREIARLQTQYDNLYSVVNAYAVKAGVQTKRGKK